LHIRIKSIHVIGWTLSMWPISAFTSHYKLNTIHSYHALSCKNIVSSCFLQKWISMECHTINQPKCQFVSRIKYSLCNKTNIVSSRLTDRVIAMHCSCYRAHFVSNGFMNIVIAMHCSCYRTKFVSGRLLTRVIAMHCSCYKASFVSSHLLNRVIAMQYSCYKSHFVSTRFLH
jgi:hypothetical protein